MKSEVSGPVEQTNRAEDAVLELRGVSKRFVIGRRTIQALRHVNLRVLRGQVTGLIGPDGAGKTTLMRLAVGLLAPDDGRIHALGFDATRDSPAVQARVGYMPQRFGLYEDLSVQENLDLYADLQGLPPDARPARYHELMHMTGLARFTTRLAGRLSGGMKQKLGLACTLVRAPELLLLDEPTVGVDPVSRRELWQIVYRLVREEGMTVLLSTAYLDEAERCHEVILMHEGEVLGCGPPQQFREQSRGRTYLVSAPGERKRTVQEKLAGAASVVDALIQGERIRLVTAGETPPDPAELLPGLAGVSIQPAPPRLEDSFVAMLKQRRKPGGDALPRVQAGRQVGPASLSSENGPGPVIEIKDVKRRFGDFYAVKGVTFEVTRGEVFGLLGANGAGKSTTFRMLCGLLPASEGSLRVAGLDLRRAAAAARARIGYMSQKFSLYGNLNVCENLRFFSSAYGLTGQRQRRRLDWALEQFELGTVADTVSLDLSLGYKQRLAMACALMHEPEILFLDEPTSGVDPLARRDFWGRINGLAAQHVTVMVTTHFMEEAECCDRLAIMADGEILALGTPQEIKRRQCSAGQPEPTMEDAFIALIEGQGQTRGGAK
ncbi:MAG: ABC transporter ATP-binding protein [Verrucomicrobiota bacterium]|nr:ABC transporter ATP-binding protein [Verrucomicrobiota bacterium]